MPPFQRIVTTSKIAKIINSYWEATNRCIMFLITPSFLSFSIRNNNAISSENCTKIIYLAWVTGAVVTGSVSRWSGGLTAPCACWGAPGGEEAQEAGRGHPVLRWSSALPEQIHHRPEIHHGLHRKASKFSQEPYLVILI